MARPKKTPETTVPVYCLRKPIYLLLKHAKDHWIEWNNPEIGIDKPSDQLSKQESENIYINNIKDLAIDEEEKIFLENQNLTIYEFIEIKNKYITSIWIKINTYWVKANDYLYNKEHTNSRGGKNQGQIEPFAKYEDVSPLIVKAIKALFRTSVTGKSSLHYGVYTPLIAWDKLVKDKKPREAAQISSSFALGICHLAKISLSGSDVNADELLQLNNIIEYIEKFREDGRHKENSKAEADKAHYLSIEKALSFWHNGAAKNHKKSIPAGFIDSDWVCYERTDGVANDQATWGIALSSVNIGSTDKNGYTPITIKSDYVSGAYCHKGLIAFEANKEHLVAHMIQEGKDEMPAFFIMRAKHMVDNEHRLLVGHFSYYSGHYEKFITKTVIWLDKKSPLLPTENFSLPDDLANTNDLFEKNVPEFVRAFLNSRLRNRLTMPSSYFTTDKESDLRHSIQKWLHEVNKNIMDDYLLYGCRGDYFVCYYYGDTTGDRLNYSDVDISKFIRIDELSISYNPDSIAFTALYIHNRNNALVNGESKSTENDRMSEVKYKELIVSRKDSTIQLLLQEYELVLQEYINPEKIKKSAREILKPTYVHLSFCIPTVHEVAQFELQQTDYFPGIISGLNDVQNDPVSFRVVVVKKEKFFKAGEPCTSVPRPEDIWNNKNKVFRRVVSYLRNNVSSDSIKINSHSNTLAEQFPYLNELVLAGGTYHIEAGTVFEVRCVHKEKDLPLKGEDLDIILREADNQVSTWNLYD